MSVAGAAFLWFCQRRGYTLYYGDAASHVNIARRLTDSRTPGYEQIGTVWLPLPHVLMAPLVRHDALWRSGLGGAIPASFFFVAAAAFLYASVRRATESRAGAVTAAGLLAFNPNLLYLQATPMTEPIFLGFLAAAVYFAVQFHTRPRIGYALAAGLAVLAATLTRYEGWFLIPFFALFFLIRRSPAAAAVFLGLACLGPLYWLGHNQYLYSDALEFYRGTHSAQAIYARGLAKGYAPYPGDHDLPAAWLYYRSAMETALGRPAVWLGVAGALAALLRSQTRPLLLFAVPIPFYLLSLHSAATPIFLPSLAPHSYYNTRYALAALPACAAAVAVIVASWPRPFLRAAAGVAALLVCLGGWVARPSVESWICWKEAEVNSRGRRDWTRQAAEFFRQRYRSGDGILTASGDVMAVYQAGGIPLRETLNDGTALQFLPAVARPDLFLRERWVVALAGDPISFHLSNPRPWRRVCERVAVFRGNENRWSKSTGKSDDHSLSQRPCGGQRFPARARGRPAGRGAIRGPGPRHLRPALGGGR